MTSTIYLLETNKKTTQEIVNYAIRSGFEIFTFANFTSLLKELKNRHADAIFINIDLVPTSDDHIRVLKNYFTVIYGDFIDYDLKHRFYRLGIDRVINASQNLPMMLVQLLQFDSYSRDELKSLLNKNITVSNLSDIHLKNIVHNAIMNQRNLVIKINDEEWFAKIRIFGGEVIDACSPGKEGIDAVLNIFQHSQGQLTLQPFSSEKETSSCNVSTFGMLAEAEYQSRLLMDFQQKIGKKNPILKVDIKTNGNNFSPEEKNVLRLVGTQINLQSIVQESPYPLSHTLSVLDHLFKKQVLSVSNSVNRQSQFTEEDISIIRSSLNQPDQKNAQILVICSTHRSKRQFLETVAKATNCKVKSNNIIDVIRIYLEEDYALQFIGIHSAVNLQKLMPNIKGNIAAIFFVFDFSRELKFEYQKYYIKQIVNQYEFPFVIGLTNLTKFGKRVIEEMRKRLEIPAGIKIVSIDPTNFQQIKQLFNQLTNIPVNDPVE